MNRKKPTRRKKSTARKRDTTDYDDVVKRIKPVKALPFTLSIVVYGRSGTGKTTFAATLPKPILLLDISEKGTDSISGTKGVDVIRIEEWDEFEQIYWFLKSGESKYASIVVDTITELQTMAIRKVMDNEGVKPGTVISKRIWGSVSGMLNPWITDYRDLPVHTAFLAHDRITEPDEDADDQLNPEVGPRLMPSVASHVCGAMKVIGQTYITEVRKKNPKTKKVMRRVEYRMRLGPHTYYLTKIRCPKEFDVPDSILNPTFDQLIKIMKGEYSEPKTKAKPKTRRR